MVIVPMRAGYRPRARKSGASPASEMRKGVYKIA
jgi:hypothetical protein